MKSLRETCSLSRSLRETCSLSRSPSLTSGHSSLFPRLFLIPRHPTLLTQPELNRSFTTNQNSLTSLVSRQTRTQEVSFILNSSFPFNSQESKDTLLHYSLFTCNCNMCVVTGSRKHCSHPVSNICERKSSLEE